MYLDPSRFGSGSLVNKTRLHAIGDPTDKPSRVALTHVAKNPLEARQITDCPAADRTDWIWQVELSQRAKFLPGCFQHDMRNLIRMDSKSGKKFVDMLKSGAHRKETEKQIRVECGFKR